MKNTLRTRFPTIDAYLGRIAVPLLSLVVVKSISIPNAELSTLCSPGVAVGWGVAVGLGGAVGLGVAVGMGVVPLSLVVDTSISTAFEKLSILNDIL